MYKTTVKIKATCPKHRKFNPGLSGEGSIKGGCSICQSIWQLYLSTGRLQFEIEAVDQEIQQFKSRK